MTGRSQSPVATRRWRGMFGWLGGDQPAPEPPAADGVAVQRNSLRRRLFDDIGTLIFAHHLTPSPRAYGVLHAYVSGDDPQTGAAVAERLRAGAGLSDASVTQIAEMGDAITTRELSRIADALEERIGTCLAAVGQSRDSAETFGTALHAEAGRLSSDPQATLARIIALTEAAVTASRLVEDQLHQARDEAEALRRDLQSARRAAERDHLTGLLNRRSFEQRLRGIEQTGRRSAVALVDIDDFKQVNDRFGHAAGDRVLKFVAGFLRAQLRRRVVVARYGGEEFALLFEDMTLEEASEALDGVRERLSRRSLIHQDSGEAIGHITFSAGVAAAADGGDALSAADLALYSAKNGGKNQIARSPR